ncbi:MAG TPA: iron-sulfur cluster repair di-iron protein [Blastocatellia bacterium]
MNIGETVTIRDLAAGVPGATRVLENFGIDYCCGGRRTLAEACEEASLRIEDLTRSLEEAGRASQPGAERDWRQESLTSLATYIIDKHHHFTRQEIDRLEKLFDKVCSRHGPKRHELFEAQKIFHELKRDLIPHMLKEEQVLFPYIARMEEAAGNGRAVPQPFFGTVRNPARVMMLEHETAGGLLRALRATSGDYTPPPDACASYQALYQALAGFEADLRQHIHLENNLLFPRAIETEDKAAPELRRSTDTSGEHRCFGN